MTDWREELIEKMAKAAWRIGEEVVLEWDQANENVREMYLREARAALAVAEPVIREQCAKICDRRYMGDNNREDMEARRCAAAIREGGREG